MEIKIVITDAGPAAGSSQKSVHIEGAAVSAASSGDAASAGGAGSGGAMAASGAAPSGDFFQPGAPQPFNAQRAANMQPPPSSTGTTSSDESAGAAPGSGA